MRFNLKVDIEFDAVDLDDAFEMIRAHFDNLCNGDPDANDVWYMGKIELKPKDAELVVRSGIGAPLLHPLAQRALRESEEFLDGLGDE